MLFNCRGRVFFFFFLSGYTEKSKKKRRHYCVLSNSVLAGQTLSQYVFLFSACKIILLSPVHTIRISDGNSLTVFMPYQSNTIGLDGRTCSVLLRLNSDVSLAGQKPVRVYRDGAVNVKIKKNAPISLATNLSLTLALKSFQVQ